MLRVGSSCTSSIPNVEQNKTSPIKSNAAVPTQTISFITPEKRSSCCSTLINRVQKLWSQFCAWVHKWKQRIFSKKETQKPEEPAIRKPNSTEDTKPPKKVRFILPPLLPPPPRPAPLDVSEHSPINYRNSLTPTAREQLVTITKHVQEFLQSRTSATPMSQENLQQGLGKFEDELNEVQLDLHRFVKEGFTKPLDKYLALLRIKETLMEKANSFFSKAETKFALSDQASISNYQKAVSLHLQAIGLCLSLEKAVRTSLGEETMRSLNKNFSGNDIEKIGFEILTAHLRVVHQNICQKVGSSDNHVLAITQLLVQIRLEELQGFITRSLQLSSAFNPQDFHILRGKDDRDRIHLIDQGRVISDLQVEVRCEGKTLLLSPLYNCQSNILN